MIKYVSVDYLSKTQLNQVIPFFKKNFPGNKKKLEKQFSIVLKNSKKQKWTLAYSKNQLCGAYLIQFKIMNYQGLKLKVCGTTYIAVDRKFQKFNVMKYFLNKLFKFSEKHDFIVGFARKKMDNYWVPYGFIGITDFGVFSINPLGIKNYDSNSNIRINNFNQQDLSKINKIYKINDSYITGNLVRKNSDYRKFIKTNPKTKIKIFKKNKHLIGYFILQNNIITEIRINPNHYIECSYCLKKYFLNKSIPNIEFNTNLNDPFLIYLSRFSHQISTRFVYEGGHVIRITNIKKLLNKLKPILEKKLINLGISKLSVNYEGISIIFKDRNISYKFVKKIDMNLVTKLVFGIIPNKNPKLKVLFGNTRIQFPILDQF